MSSIVVSRSGDFCVIVQQLLGRADDRPREPRMIEYVKNLWKDSGIRDMRAISRQEVVYVMMGDHRDMKGIDARRSRQNRFPEYFFGDFQDRLLDRQDGHVLQSLKAGGQERRRGVAPCCGAGAVPELPASGSLGCGTCRPKRRRLRPPPARRLAARLAIERGRVKNPDPEPLTSVRQSRSLYSRSRRWRFDEGSTDGPRQA